MTNMRVCKLCHQNLEDDPSRCGCGTPRPARGWPDDLWIGLVVDGRYRIESRLGVGGMGVAYRAYDELEDRPVAIKAMHAHLADNENQARRFRREARAAQVLKGPHAVRVFGTGEGPDGALFIVMELVEGEQLTQRLGRGNLKLEEAVGLLRQLAVALAEAHSVGLVHRDLKPDNLLLSYRPEGLHLQVLDFGIVKVLDERLGTVGATATGAVFGTPEYMAPEQAAGRGDLDHRADIFSAGVVAFLMISGRMPFSGPTVQAIMMARLVEDAPGLSSVCDWPVPPDLEALIAGMLERDPKRRVQQMSHVIEALDGVPLPTLERPLPISRSTAPTRDLHAPATPSRRKSGEWRRWIVGGLAFVAGMLAVAWLVGRA